MQTKLYLLFIKNNLKYLVALLLILLFAYLVTMPKAKAKDVSGSNKILSVYDKGKTTQILTDKKTIEEALKDVPSNTVVNKVIKTKYGYHIAFVKENDNNQQWSVEHILIVPYPSEKTVTEKLEKLNKVKAEIEAGTLVLNDKIDEDVIQSFDAKGITADGVIPNFVYSPEIGKAVYNSELNKVGILKPNKATIVVFQKTKETKAEDNGFDKLKEEIKSDYINNKVAEYMSKLF